MILNLISKGKEAITFIKTWRSGLFGRTMTRSPIGHKRVKKNNPMGDPSLK